MTNYDDIERQEAAQVANIKAAAMHDLERAAKGDEVADDDVFDYLDSESLASWNLKRIRTALGVSQQEISDRLKVSRWRIRLAQTQVAKIERGERPWRVNEMFAIAEVLGVEWDELFRGNGLADDANLEMLAARLKFQEVEDAENQARGAWRIAAVKTHEAGAQMLMTAAKLGIKDPYVMRYLEMRYFTAKSQDQQAVIPDRETLRQRNTEAQEYAEGQWQRLLDAARGKGNKDPHENSQEE